jgi:hypothetical protein
MVENKYYQQPHLPAAEQTGLRILFYYRVTPGFNTVKVYSRINRFHVGDAYCASPTNDNKFICIGVYVHGIFAFYTDYNPYLFLAYVMVWDHDVQVLFNCTLIVIYCMPLYSPARLSPAPSRDSS